MAVEIIRASTSDTDRTKVIREYHGLSSDTKPTPADLASESTFWAIDTRVGYVYSLTNAGSNNGWWEV